MYVDLRTLRSFVVVAEELHFTRAAELLNVSQPALSKQINQLERQLRLTLLRRTSRHVELTAAGQALLPGARVLLAGWSELIARVHEEATAEARTLRVGFIANAANELTPLIVARFTGQCPGWRVAMSQAPWTDPSAGLLDGNVDVALLRPPIPGAERIQTRPVLTEDRCVALAAGHPLAQQEVVRFEQLLDEPFIALPAETGVWRDFWLAREHRDGRPILIGAEVKTSDEWMEAIANNFGVCLTGASTARFYQRPGVVYRMVDTISPTEVVVAWRRDDRRRVVHAFVAACAFVAAETSGADPVPDLGRADPSPLR
jgi:DNA-binding transcriptional LysR family regulator